MPVGSVVLTPGAPGAAAVDWSAIADRLRAAGVPVVLPPVPAEDDGHPSTGPAQTAHWVAHCAVGIASVGAPAPLLLVAVGPAGAMLPALGFAQRAARRPVIGYVLVDADLPRYGASSDWPDAPVTVIATPADPGGSATADEARRRGWEVVHDPDVPAALLAVASRP